MKTFSHCLQIAKQVVLDGKHVSTKALRLRSTAQEAAVTQPCTAEELKQAIIDQRLGRIGFQTDAGTFDTATLALHEGEVLCALVYSQNWRYAGRGWRRRGEERCELRIVHSAQVYDEITASGHDLDDSDMESGEGITVWHELRPIPIAIAQVLM